jgi:hypothetical protein
MLSGDEESGGRSEYVADGIQDSGDPGDGMHVVMRSSECSTA